MTTIRYAVQGPGNGAAILGAVREMLSSGDFVRMTGLYAFASHKGARLFVEEAKKAACWKAAAKRWVISIDGGITEPDALRFLVQLRRSEVRVPDAEGLLSRRLNPTVRFHPKTLLLERQSSGFEPTAVLVGSANLTCNGLCFGHENALSVQSGGAALPPMLGESLQGVEKVLADATIIDNEFIERYEAIRPARPTLTEEFEGEQTERILQNRAVIPATMSAALAAASHYWIEIRYVVSNRGSSEEGNQIDMSRGARVFFGFGDQELRTNSPIGTVRILYEGHAALRNLRFGDNSMDKLDLPIPGVEGPTSYANQTLLFTREERGSFQLVLGSARDVAGWKARSRSRGTVFAMRSGREFGVF